MEGKVLEVNNLTKTYGSKGFQTKVLKGISLSICERDFIAIMGPSGSGKTTLLNMLSTIDKPTHGSVILDGKDITKIHNKELSKIRRDKVGFIFQDYNLLDTMSLQDNIALPLSLNGVPASECIQRTRQMGAMFGLKEHLEKYPYQLSGGQKQRLSIARVFLKNPPILIFDEATSALDNESEQVVQKSLEELAKDRTTFVIAHRLSTIRHAKRILVLTENGIEEEGTHEELMSKKGVYESLYQMQFRS